MASIDPAPGEAHNYFALLEIDPKELILKLVSQHAFHPTVLKVASMMRLDPVDVVLEACIVPAFAQKGTKMQLHLTAAISTIAQLSSELAPLPSQFDASATSTLSSGTNLVHLSSSDIQSGPLAPVPQQQNASIGTEESGRPELKSANGVAALQRHEEKAQRGSRSMGEMNATDTAGLVEALVREEVQFIGSSGQAWPQPICRCPICTEKDRDTYQALPGFAGQDAPERKCFRTGICARIVAQPEGKPTRGGLKRKTRLPGIKGAEDASIQLTTGLLTGIAAIDPSRAAVTAVLLLFERRNGWSASGLLRLQTGGDELEQDVQPEATAISVSGSPARTSADDRADISDTKLLQLALQFSEKDFPVLHRWVKLQLRTNPALADLQDGPGKLAHSLAICPCSFQLDLQDPVLLLNSLKRCVIASHMSQQ